MTKVFAVTGAAGALGSVVARRLAADGHEVVAVDMAPVSAPASRNGLALGRVDLTDAEEVHGAFEQAASRFGGLSGLANIAGGFAWEKIDGGSVETWDRLYALNVKTALNACRAALPLLAEGAAIVNVGAAGAAKGELGMGAYAASKSALARLTESLAAELRPRGIRVNAVLPSIIDTPANRASMTDADFSLWVTPAELAEVIAFLLSDQASGINGASIPVVGRV